MAHNSLKSDVAPRPTKCQEATLSPTAVALLIFGFAADRGLVSRHLPNQYSDPIKGSLVSDVDRDAPVVRNLLVELFTLAAQRLTACFGGSATLSVTDNCRRGGGDARL